MATLGGWLPGGWVEPVHGTLFSVKFVGFGSLPCHVPLKPIVVDAPVPSEPFQGWFVPVTSAPDWVQFAPQPVPLSCWPAAKLNFSVQDGNGSPRFCTAMFALNPPW